MTVTFLGTGTSQGVPVITCECEVCRSVDFRDKRLRSSVHFQIGDKSLVVDTGPDFRQQMLRERIRKLDAILYTHEHKDHTAGLDDVRSFNFSQRKDMPIYGRRKVIEQIKTEFAYAFAEVKYPGVPMIETKEIDNAPFIVEGIEVLPVEVLHHKLPVLGFRIDDFTYITDANFISDREIEKIKGTKVLVLNALQKTEHISHFTLDEAVGMARRIGAEQTYFTHISHKLGLHAEVSAELPEGMALAYDGLKVHL
ncbi:MAG: MBL fold metallo-hydrolase [Bacteroidota bacterium]